MSGYISVRADMHKSHNWNEIDPIKNGFFAPSSTPLEHHPPSITQLAERGQSKCNQDLSVWWRCIEWMVDKVRHKCSKAPVVGTILEQIENGHGGMTKPAAYRKEK